MWVGAWILRLCAVDVAEICFSFGWSLSSLKLGSFLCCFFLVANRGGAISGVCFLHRGSICIDQGALLCVMDRGGIHLLEAVILMNCGGGNLLVICDVGM